MYGRLVVAAMKRGRDEDGKVGEDGLAAGGAPTQSALVDEVGGKRGCRQKKGKAMQTVSAPCGPEKPSQGTLLQQMAMSLRPSGAHSGTPCRSRGAKARVKAKSRAMEAKAKGKGKDLYFHKGQCKGVSALSTQTRKHTGRRSPGVEKKAHGTRSEPCPGSRRGAQPVPRGRVSAG